MLVCLVQIELGMFYIDTCTFNFPDGNVQSGDGTTISLSTVLAFFTGAESVPLLGFKEPFKLKFLFGDEQKFATASTCDLVLRIPTCHKTYEVFKEYFIQSLLETNFYCH